MCVFKHRFPFFAGSCHRFVAYEMSALFRLSPVYTFWKYLKISALRVWFVYAVV
eukprot:NODE_9528_length_315_cov_82.097744_g7760_i0.p3 GENE.NODE_9528_length_315_cov_82.097744_g7760_i0~~NODE_9528_length_315_cov_82.097744_g7760_i0.p3  ORF type:complete len:54 (+),score=1.65 NODE_9528_length_315_cov_82.097744_g7760_i0:141-302(+)